ncbi:MAG TPA: hypothetical protein VFI09_08125 [Solirubrobacterales bacterium]|nr:hypothetical protein [Solirubrobacterales bacterium]
MILVAAVRFDGSKLAPTNSVMETDPRLNDMLRQLNQLDRVTARAAYGLPVEELGTFGEEVDLLLLGARGEGPKGRLVIERIPKHLARTARRTQRAATAWSANGVPREATLAPP